MRQRVLCFVLCLVSYYAWADDTVLKLYKAFGEPTEQLLPVPQKQLSGQCLMQSQLILREDAWHCVAEGKNYDPCFVKAGPNQQQVLCPESPWSSQGVTITLNQPLNNEEHKPLDMSRTLPWAIELTNGEHCQAIYTQETYEGMPIRYRCSNQNILMGYLQRCKPIWSVLEKTGSGVQTVQLKKAWF